MTQKFYVDSDGNYLGSFDGVEPEGGVEVAVPPPTGKAKLVGGEWIVPVEVPATVTPLQARRALRAAGLLATVNAWVGAQDEDTQDAWEFASVIERNGPIVVGAGAALGLSETQIDALFIAAAQL